MSCVWGSCINGWNQNISLSISDVVLIALHLACGGESHIVNTILKAYYAACVISLIITLTMGSFVNVHGVTPPVAASFSNMLKIRNGVIYSNLDGYILSQYKEYIKGYYNWIKTFGDFRTSRVTIFLVDNNELRERFELSDSVSGSYKDHVVIADIDHNFMNSFNNVFHELTHHYIQSTNNFRDSDPWFHEGLAGFFEQWNPSTKILPNYIKNLDRVLLKLDRYSLDTYLSGKENDRELAYTFIAFMYERNLLKAYLEEMLTTNYTERRVIEKIFHEPLFRVEQQWKSWLKDKR